MESPKCVDFMYSKHVLVGKTELNSKSVQVQILF